MKFIDRITEFLARKIGQDKAASLVQLACFCVVGGINTLVDMGIFSLIYYVFLGGNEALYPLPFAAGYLCGVACSFVLNKLVTFRDKGSAKRQWLRGGVVQVHIRTPQLSNLSRQATLPYGVCTQRDIADGAMALLRLAGITGVLAKLITVPVTLVINFLGSRLIVFRREKKDV